MIDTIWNWLIQNWEGVLAISALTLTTMQIYYTRKHNRLSVRPHLDTFSENNLDNNILTYKLYLDNNGLGPAEIKSFEVKYKKNFSYKQHY